MTSLAISATLLFSLFAGANTFAHQAEECELRLALPLTRLVMLANTQGQLDLAAIDALAQSATPYNPLRNVTITTRSSQLKRALEENIRVLPRANWPDVQHELRALANDIRRKQDRSADAKKATADLFLPDVAYEFKKGSLSNDNAFVYTDEHGHLISIFIAGPLKSGPCYLEITDLTANTPTERTYIGDLFANEFSAYVTAEHRVRIAFQAEFDALRIIALPDVENSQTLYFKKRLPDRSTFRPEIADSSPSNFLITKSGRRLIAATNHQTIQVFDLDNPRDPIFEYTTDFPMPALRLFESSSGKILLGFKNDLVLMIVELNDNHNQILVSKPMRTTINSFAFGEDREGTVYVSAVSVGQYFLFTPLSSPEPRFKEYLLGVGGHENFWFRDSEGRELNYVMSLRAISNNGDMVGEVAVFDVASKRRIFNRESEMFHTGGPFVKGLDGNPLLVVVGGRKHPTAVSVIDPVLDSAIQGTLSRPIDHTGFQSMQKFLGPNGEEGLLVNGKHKGSVIKLLNPPTSR